MKNISDAADSSAVSAMSALIHIELDTVLYHAYYVICPFLPAVISSCFFIDDLYDFIAVRRKEERRVREQLQDSTDLLRSHFISLYGNIRLLIQLLF